MIPYRDIDNDSGVVAYEYGDNYIVVKFYDGTRYEYTYISAGVHNIEQMKLLANRGDGLNAYIQDHVRI